MDIVLHHIPVRDLVKNYVDSDEEGVVGYDGLLNIRPPYQREFVYSEKQREAVIDTVFRGFPLNTMYWAVTDSGFEIIDGQQRTVSIAQFVDGVFSYKSRYFHNLQPDEKLKVLNFELTVYQCNGSESEKLDWFRTINIAGEKLTDQELRNAVYAGPWTADAKRLFSKSQCAAARIGDRYLDGSPIRQDYLETVIDWISGGKIDDYMAVHQLDPSANEIWIYFQNVITWVEASFPRYRREMKGLPWGALFNRFKHNSIDPKQTEAEIAVLMVDDEVTRKRGVYEYILTGDERYLSIRTFSESVKRKMYETQGGKCASCTNMFDISAMEADHITPWSQGGKTEISNGQMLCRDCNRRKSAK